LSKDHSELFSKRKYNSQAKSRRIYIANDQKAYLLDLFNQKNI